MMNSSDHNNTNSNGDGETQEDILPSEKTLVVVDDRSSQPPPLLSSYNDKKHKMRPLFDAIRTLRCMNVIEKGDEGITLQPIVVVGDQSSGKSSLIESLTGIGLPRICTRVPLIIKFRHRSDRGSELHLEYKDKCIPVNETNASAWISSLTESLAGTGKEISNVPLTLVVKKNNVPDLTIVDLPGVPVQGQSEIISGILEEYIKFEDCIILHVIAASTANFPTCESTKILDKFDKNGEMTLHVCTKSDEATKDMVAIVSTNYMGPDYVCVRNRLGEETHEEAREKEASLFETHHLFSKIDKSVVGVRVLAEKLLLVQVEGVSHNLCALVGVINKELDTCVALHNRLQQHNFTTVSEAMPAFRQIIIESIWSLYNVFKNVMDKFPDEADLMDWKTRLREISGEFSQELKNNQVEEHEFLLVEERKWSLEQAFHFLFERKIAYMSTIINTFVSRVWDYIEIVIIKVLGLHAKNSHPQLLLSLKIAAKKVIASEKERFKDRLLELLDPNKIREYYKRDERVMYSRNELKKRMIACLEMVHKSFFDSAELDLPDMFTRMVCHGMQRQLVNELKSDDENRYKPLLKELPSMATRRWKLKNRIELLEKSKKVVENAMNEISFHNF